VARDPGNQDEDFEITQRRSLVDQWASMSQETRDSYQGRAPARPSLKWHPSQLNDAMSVHRMKYGFCNLTVRQPLVPRNRALWTKIRILLYNLQDAGSTWHNFGTDKVVEMHPNPADRSPVTPENYHSYCFIETADFDHMAMTSQGTAFFYGFDRGSFFVDQEALDTGRLLFCDFRDNGEVMASTRTSPLLTYMIWCHHQDWDGARIIEQFDPAHEDHPANAA
jgi:hypothetical protein